MNYIATSNHIHLLVIDSGNDVIPRSMQLIAGRTGQAYNQRKGRKGAFWEDRYHATAIDRGAHLIRCLVYIDLNMVRAGAVDHPSEWESSGYNEIQNPPERYGLIDQQGLLEYGGISDKEQLKADHFQWVEEVLKEDESRRDGIWTETIAVGNRAFIEETQDQLGIRAIGRWVEDSNGLCVLKEDEIPYSSHFNPEKGALSPKNSYIWNDNAHKSK